MARPPRPVPLASVRRLAVARQHLGGEPPPRASPDRIVDVVRDLGYVQWDPVTIVAPSHEISLWNRLDGYSPAALQKLLWEEKRLFEHWTPIASVVLTEDYPIYRSLMQRYPESLTSSWGNVRRAAVRFLAENAALRRRLLAELRKGPRTVGEFEDHVRTRRNDGVWTPRSDVARMLEQLSMSGEAMVVGHRGTQNLWGLAETFLPSGTDRVPLSAEAFESAAAQRAIRALGTATPREITYYFVRGRYHHLRATLARLEREGKVHRVSVPELTGREERFVHDRDLARLASIGDESWEPRLSMLPPFDNLVASSARTSRLFGFDYVREQFLPKEKRRYGTYVLPLLWGDRFIGRIDPRLDKAEGTLEIQAVHAEPDLPKDPDVAEAIDARIRGFAEFLGARRVTYPSRVPGAWKAFLR